MTAFDYVALAILGSSMLLGMMRGLVREGINLLAWIGAFWVSNAYTAEVVRLLPEAIPTDSLRFLAAFVILFLSTLLLMSLVTIALTELVQSLGMGVVDKGLGALFGLARAGLILLTLVLLAGLTNLPKQDFWRNAMFSAPLETFAITVKPWLPAGFSARIRYE